IVIQLCTHINQPPAASQPRCRRRGAVVRRVTPAGRRTPHHRRSRMIRRTFAALALATLCAAPAVAQVPVLDVRLGAHAALPSGDLGDAFDAGFGAYGRLGAPVGPLKLMASVTWNRLKAASPFVEDVDVVTITG